MRSRAHLLAGMAALLVAPLASAQYSWGPALTSGDTGHPANWSRVHFDPTNSNTVWASTGDLPDVFSSDPPEPANGIWRSTNGGSTWSQMASGALDPEHNILDFTICKANPDVMYVGTNIYGVFRSTNGGSSWTAANNGITHDTETFPNAAWGVGAIVVDPTDPMKVYCSVGQLSGLDIFNLSPDHPGFFYSHDAGQTWTANNNGLPPRQDGIGDLVSNTSAPLSLAVPEDSPNTVYAGLLTAEANIKLLFGTKARAQTQVFRNTAAGTGTWSDLSSGLPQIEQASTLGTSLARIAVGAALITVGPAGGNHVVYLSSLGFGIEVSLLAETLKSKSRGIFALAPGSSTWLARNNDLPVVNDNLNQNAINTSPVAIHPNDPYIGLTGVVESDVALPNASKIWATTDAGDPWLQSWGDSGLNQSPTLGQDYCNSLFIEIAPNGSRAVAAIAWTDPDSLLNLLDDDDGIYMVPAP
ncbi:MAG: hypothetical protein CME06_06355 [Gemmatimonadetes bacterium]|nr:hypothetical protein [Gemmatimonadota bacterium]